MSREKTINEFWPEPPKPFNPDFNPKARGAMRAAAEEMEEDGFYDAHTREECSVEIKKRTDAILKKGTPS